MIGELFTMSGIDKKVIEPVLKDENIHYMHMVLPKGEALPVHTTNANVYMTVVSGTLTLSLNGEEAVRIKEKTVVKIPFETVMDAKNLDSGTLELLVVKAPAPKS